MCENGDLWVQQKGQKVIYVFVSANMERNETAGPELILLTQHTFALSALTVWFLEELGPQVSDK